MQFRELKGILPTSFKVSDLHDDEVMIFNLDCDPQDEGDGDCYNIEARFASRNHSSSLELIVPTASEDCVIIIVRDKDGEKEVAFSREFFLNFLSGIMDLQKAQHGEDAKR